MATKDLYQLYRILLRLPLADAATLEALGERSDQSLIRFCQVDTARFLLVNCDATQRAQLHTDILRERKELSGWQ